MASNASFLDLQQAPAPTVAAPPPPTASARKNAHYVRLTTKDTKALEIPKLSLEVAALNLPVPPPPTIEFCAESHGEGARALTVKSGDLPVSLHFKASSKKVVIYNIDNPRVLITQYSGQSRYTSQFHELIDTIVMLANLACAAGELQTDDVNNLLSLGNICFVKHQKRVTFMIDVHAPFNAFPVFTNVPDYGNDSLYLSFLDGTYTLSE